MRGRIQAAALSSGIMLALLLASYACQPGQQTATPATATVTRPSNSTSTSVLTPTATATPMPTKIESRPTATALPRTPVPKSIYSQLAQGAVTAIIGRTGPTWPEIQVTEKGENDLRLVFRDWDVKVDRYVLGPQPFEILRVRSFTGTKSFSRPELPVAGLVIPSLNPDGSFLLLLDKWEPNNTHLDPDQFTIVANHADQARGYTGFFEVDGSNARIVKANMPPPFTGPWEPIESLIEAMTAP